MDIIERRIFSCVRFDIISDGCSGKDPSKK